MNGLKLYYLDYDPETMQYDAGTVIIDNVNQTDEINSLLNAEAYDIADYTEEISILVDDTGFFKKNLPVWHIKTPDGTHLELVGKLLFVRNVETEYSVDFASIKAEDIFNFRIGLNIELLGLKK